MLKMAALGETGVSRSAIVKTYHRSLSEGELQNLHMTL